MRTMKIVVTVMLAASPLIVQAAAASDWLKVAYRCENGQEMNIDYRRNGSAVRVSLGDQRAEKLIWRPARKGFRYGGSIYELRGDGNDVSWQSGNKTPLKCTSLDPHASEFAVAAERVG